MGLHLLGKEQSAGEGDSLQGRGVFSRLQPAVPSCVGGRQLNRYSWLWAAVRRGQRDESGRTATRQSQPVPHCSRARGIGVLPLENKNTIAIKRSSECDCLFGRDWPEPGGFPLASTHIRPRFPSSPFVREASRPEKLSSYRDKTQVAGARGMRAQGGKVRPLLKQQGRAIASESKVPP